MSIQQGAGNYWNGASFASATEVFTAATGTTSWSLGFVAANFPANGTYNLRAGRPTTSATRRSRPSRSRSTTPRRPRRPAGLGARLPGEQQQPALHRHRRGPLDRLALRDRRLTGGIVASGTAAAFASPGLNPADIADNSTTSYSRHRDRRSRQRLRLLERDQLRRRLRRPGRPQRPGIRPRLPREQQQPALHGYRRGALHSLPLRDRRLYRRDRRQRRRRPLRRRRPQPHRHRRQQHHLLLGNRDRPSRQRLRLLERAQLRRRLRRPGRPHRSGIRPRLREQQRPPPHRHRQYPPSRRSTRPPPVPAASSAAAPPPSSPAPASTPQTSPTTAPPPTRQPRPTKPATSPPARARSATSDSAAPAAHRSGLRPRLPREQQRPPGSPAPPRRYSTVSLYATAACTGGIVGSSRRPLRRRRAQPHRHRRQQHHLLLRHRDRCSRQRLRLLERDQLRRGLRRPGRPQRSGQRARLAGKQQRPPDHRHRRSPLTVSLYATATCTGGIVASGTAAAFAGAGLNPADIADNTTTSYSATATDQAGNISACSSAISCLEDSTNPASVEYASTAGGSFYRTATWNNPTGTASDAGGAGLLRVEVSIQRVSTTLYWNGSAFADAVENWRNATGTAAWSLTFPAANFPADGNYACRVRAIDNASNTQTATSYTVTIDNAAPNTSITAQPSDPTNSTAPSFSFTSSEGGSTFECQLDGGGYSCTSPKSYAGQTQTARTRSRSAPPTWPATSTPRPLPSPGRSTRPSRRARSRSRQPPGSIARRPGATSVAPPPTPAAQCSRTFRSRSSASPTASTGTVRPSLTPSRTGATQPEQPPGHSPSPPPPTSPPTAAIRSASAQRTPRPMSRALPSHGHSRSTLPRRTRRSARSRTIRPTRPRPPLLHLQRGRLDLRVPTRRRRLLLLHQPEELHRPNPGLTHLPGPRHRPRRQPRRNPRLLHLDDEHDRADQRDRLPGSRRRLSHLDLERLLGHRSRHRRRGPRDGADLDPARLHLPLLEWVGLRGRQRELAHRHGNRILVARVRRLELPRRRRLHDPGPRNRHRDQRADDAGLAHLHDRHHCAEHDDQRAAERSDQLDRALLLLHLQRGRLDLECQLDGGGYTSCTSPKSYTGQTQGSHTFQVRATDPAGNLDATPASFTWTIDTTEPTSAIAFPAAAGIYRTATWADFSGTAADTGGAALATVQISIQRVSTSLYWNGSAFADGSENWRTATGTASWSLAFAVSNFPADGDYTIRVRATDTATNVQTTPVSRTFTIDTTAPNTTISAQPERSDQLDRALLLLHLQRGRLDLRVPARRRRLHLLHQPEELHRPNPGLTRLQVRATDPAGNLDATPASYTWTIDTTAPSTVV